MRIAHSVRRPGPKLIVVPPECRTSVFVRHNILIPAGTRCCPGHIKYGILEFDSIEKLKTIDHAFVKRTAVLDMLQRTRLDFDDDHSLSETDYTSLNGFNKEKFKDDIVEDMIRNTPARSQRTSIAIFLCKMKSEMSNKFLATLFNISKASIRPAISTVRKALMTKFVPDNLGFGHVLREEVIKNHKQPLAQTLFGSVGQQEVILVLYGTYIFIEKSNNFYFQCRSYSTHKGRPLVKPMVIVTTSGYYIIGPYLADSKNNDASILNHILKTNVEDIQSWRKEDDIFIVDRGFRDSISLLEDLGIKAEMPRFLVKGQKQMSTEDANMSRLVTKVRWVVESSNARIKSWKYLDHTLPTNQVPYTGAYIRIVCAMSNKYFRPLSSCDDPDKEEVEAAKMLYLSRQVNSLKLFVEENDLARKSACWQASVESDLHDFPVLDEDQLWNITCGTYQLKLSSSYMQEHIDGESDIYIHKEDRGLIRVKIQSHHTSSKKSFSCG